MHTIEPCASGWNVVFLESAGKITSVGEFSETSVKPVYRTITTCDTIDEASLLANRLNGGMATEATLILALAVEESARG